MDIKVIDLFCGAGGLTYGMKKAGLNVVAGIDIEGNCRFAYEKNNNAKFIQKDISAVTKEEIDPLFSNAKFTVLAGCAPCQPFSSYTKDTKKNNDWSLLHQFKRLVQDISPDIITMENVPGVLKHDVYKDFYDNLINNEYHVWVKVINCANYGVPQNRKRLVLLASKFGEIPLIKSENEQKVTVRDVIGDLPPIKSGEIDGSDALHRSSKLSPINQKRISKSIAGGTWKDWPIELRSKCHTKKSGETYSSVYGRMLWDAPSPTITTLCCGFGNGRFGHPEQDRAISLREASLLQTFPSDYLFYEEGKTISTKEICKMIGNAVPVKIGEVIGKTILKHLENK